MGNFVFTAAAKRTTYLATISNLAGVKIFQNCYFENEKGDLVDVCKGGRFSCVLLVSSVLKRFDLIKNVRVTVGSLERELLDCDWRDEGVHCYLNPPGSVLFWEPWLGADGEQHRHVGFSLGPGRCVSNDPRDVQKGGTLVPIEHESFMRDILEKPRYLEKIFCPPLY